MGIRRRVGIVALVMFAIFGISAVARAQEPAPHWTLGGGGGAMFPTGALREHVDNSAAWEMFVAWRPRADRPWGARLTFHYADYAHSDTTYALAGTDSKVRTSSAIYLVLLGPQLTFGSGRARGVLHASTGVGTAGTRTAIRGGTNDVGHRNQTDSAVALELGGALSFQLTRSELLALELGARWFGTPAVEYVPDGGIQRANGQLVLTTREDALTGTVIRGSLVLALDRLGRKSRRP